MKTLADVCRMRAILNEAYPDVRSPVFTEKDWSSWNEYEARRYSWLKHMDEQRDRE